VVRDRLPVLDDVRDDVLAEVVARIRIGGVLFQELDRKTEKWGPPKVSIVRFKKSNGVYRKQSSFNISSQKQARQIVEVIERWYGPPGKEPDSSTAEPAAVTTEPDEES